MPDDATGRDMGAPALPPEASLIRLVRLGARLTTAEAARKAGISKARWSQVENGHERKEGELRPVSASDGLLARMADAVGLSADRLDEAGRPDAAAIVREMDRRKRGEPDEIGDWTVAQCTVESSVLGAAGVSDEIKHAFVRQHRAKGHSRECGPFDGTEDARADIALTG